MSQSSRPFVAAYPEITVLSTVSQSFNALDLVLAIKCSNYVNKRTLVSHSALLREVDLLPVGKGKKKHRRGIACCYLGETCLHVVYHHFTSTCSRYYLHLLDHHCYCCAAVDRRLDLIVRYDSYTVSSHIAKHKGFRLQPWMCLFWNKELHSNEVPIRSSS